MFPYVFDVFAVLSDCYVSFQNILRKMKKSNKVRDNLKILISIIFKHFLCASARNLFLDPRPCPNEILIFC